MKRDIMNVNKNSHQANRQESSLALSADTQPHLSPRIFPLLVPSSSQRLVSVFLAADKGVPWCESSAETGAQCCPALLLCPGSSFPPLKWPDQNVRPWTLLTVFSGNRKNSTRQPEVSVRWAPRWVFLLLVLCFFRHSGILKYCLVPLML